MIPPSDEVAFEEVGRELRAALIITPEHEVKATSDRARRHATRALLLGAAALLLAAAVCLLLSEGFAALLLGITATTVLLAALLPVGADVHDPHSIRRGGAYRR